MRRRGAAVAFRGSEPSVHPGRRAVAPAEVLFEPVIAELPHKIPQPEHVLEELVHEVSPTGCSGQLRKAVPLLPRAPAQNRRPLSTRCRQNATRLPTATCPWAGGVGPPLAPHGGSGARGAASGRSPRACAPGVSSWFPTEEARLWEDGDAREPLLPDAEPALHRRLAVPGLQRSFVACCCSEVAGVDVGGGVGRAQGCVFSVHQWVVALCPLCNHAKCLHGAGRRSSWLSLPAMMSLASPGPGGVLCRTVSWDAAQSALCSSASLLWEVARANRNGCSMSRSQAQAVLRPLQGHLVDRLRCARGDPRSPLAVCMP